MSNTTEEPDEEPMTLFAFVKRKGGLTRQQFLDHWHHHHGPLIRDTPGLGDRTVRYEQHPARRDDRSGWDGVAVQEFASWEDFLAMLEGDTGEAMRADEANFLDPSSIKVVFTEGRVVIVGHDAASAGSAPASGAPGDSASEVQAVADLTNEDDIDAVIEAEDAP